MLDSTFLAQLSAELEQSLTPLPPVSPDSPEPVDMDNPPLTQDTKADIIIDVTKVKTPEVIDQEEVITPETIANEMRMIRRRLDIVEHLADNNLRSYAGTEGLGSFIGKALLGLVNIVGHVVKLFTTALFHGWRDFKRSELSAYCDSNIATMRVLFNLEDIKILNVSCDIPRGMLGTYPDAVTALLTYADTLNMTERARQLSDFIDRLFDDITSTSAVMPRYTATINNELVPKDLTKQYEALGKIFTNGSKDHETFEKLFGSMAACCRTVERCRDADAHLRGVAGVHDKLMDINDQINGLVTNSGDKITASQVKDLVNIIRTIAYTFEQYSVAMNDLSRVDHNLTLTLRKVRTTMHL